MSELQHIEQALQEAARRRRLVRAMNGFWAGLVAGGIVVLLALSAYKLFPIPYWSVTAAGITGGLCLLAGFIIGGRHKTSLDDTARCVDDRQHLQERLSTALEVAAL